MRSKTNIKLIEGLHLTATEKRSIRQMIDLNFIAAINSTKTKSYQIVEKIDEKRYRIKIGSYATWTIGDRPKWQYRIETIEAN